MIEEARVEDIPTIVTMKKRMFTEVNMQHHLHENFMNKVNATYRELYATEKAVHFIIKENKEVVACAGGFIKEDIPYCFYQEEKYGFIGDVYVHPDYRNRGYARLLTSSVMNWFAQKDIHTIRLLASSGARHLYESLGFKSTDEMILNTDAR